MHWRPDNLIVLPQSCPYMYSMTELIVKLVAHKNTSDLPVYIYILNTSMEM